VKAVGGSLRPIQKESPRRWSHYRPHLVPWVRPTNTRSHSNAVSTRIRAIVTLIHAFETLIDAIFMRIHAICDAMEGEAGL